LSRLGRICHTVQAVADAISAALGIETEVVDDELTIVAATGRYRDKVGQKEEEGRVDAGYLYGRVLTTGSEYIVEDAAQDPTYDPSVARGETEELAEVCAPITVEGDVVGVIGLVAFDKTQRETLLGNKEQFLLFVRHMGTLVASKVSETENSDRLGAIIESIHEGVIAVNNAGQVTHCNRKGEELIRLGRPEILGQNLLAILPRSSITEVVATGKGYVDREETCDRGGERLRFMVTAKPLFSGDRTIGAVASLRDCRDVYRMVTDMTGGGGGCSFEDIKGTSEALTEVKERALKIAASNSTVLIMGESGTGKDLFARAVHAASPRASGPFVTVNCGAIPETLLESELFGYEGGAFTGARREGKAGKFELASGGTIFLDEIGDLPLHLQVKLLHVLQRREVERIGSQKVTPVDVRVIAATNHDLEEMLGEGEFRIDLFYRLSVIPLRVPPLRERRGDIAVLVDHFLSKHSSLARKFVGGAGKEVLDLFYRYDWPGNVRELENVVEYAVNMESGSVITLASVPSRVRTSPPEQGPEIPLRERVALFERSLIGQYLQRFGNTLEGKRRAAQALGIGQATLYRKIKE
jgi:PAS domain S-box-containing protein